jgi:hypothetical protein
MGFVPLNPSYDSSDIDVGWVEWNETHHIPSSETVFYKIAPSDGRQAWGFYAAQAFRAVAII